MKPIGFLFLGLLMAMPVCAEQDMINPEDDAQNTLSYIEEAVAQKKTDKTTIERLKKELADDTGDVRVRERAAWALGKLGATSAVQTLLQAAQNKGLLVRSAAINALVELRSSAALPILLETSKSDPILVVRQRSALALGLIRSEKAIPTLVDLSSDPREEIRGATALALGAMHSQKNDATQILKEMTQDTSPYVQDRAQHALDGIKKPVDQLRTHLSSSDPDVRLFAAVHFGKRGRSSDVKFLKEAAGGDADEDVRKEINLAIKAIQKRAAAAKKAAQAKAAANKNPSKK